MRNRSCTSKRGIAVVLTLAFLSGCASKTVLVHVPPQLDMGAYATTGIIEFAANADAAIAKHATRQFQESVQRAQPGTRFIEIGSREHVLAAVGARELDTEAIRKIGQKYGVAALFLGEITYSDPKVDIVVFDPYEAAGCSQGRGQGRHVEPAHGNEFRRERLSSSSWAKRQLGSVRVSGEIGVSGRVSQSNPREEMVPDMVYHLTHDFRSTSVRQRVE